MWQTSDVKGSPLLSLDGRLDRTHKVISGPSKTRDGWHATSVGNLLYRREAAAPSAASQFDWTLLTFMDFQPDGHLPRLKSRATT